MALRTAMGSELGRCSARMIVSRYLMTVVQIWCKYPTVRIALIMSCGHAIHKHTLLEILRAWEDIGRLLLFTFVFFRCWDMKAGIGRPDVEELFCLWSTSHPPVVALHCLAFHQRHGIACRNCIKTIWLDLT